MIHKYLKLVSLIFFSVFSMVNLVNAQDFLFSQPFSTPININPALTGLYNAEFRIAASYRNQWFNSLGQSYTNFSGLMDLRMKPFKNNDNDIIAGGFTFYTAQEGQTPVETYKFIFSGAYHKSLDYHKRNTISAGVYFGPIQKGIDFNRIKLEDQFNGTDFTNPTRELLPDNNISYSDFAIGLNYQYDNDLYFASIGLSALHINQPNISPFREAEINNGEDLLARSYNLHANVRIPIYYESLFLNPRLIANVQGEFKNYVLGTSVYFPLEELRTYSNFHIGLYSKFGNKLDSEFSLYDITALVGLEFHPFVVGVSYDLNTHALSNYSAHQGSFEITLSYFGNKDSSSDKLLSPLF